MSRVRPFASAAGAALALLLAGCSSEAPPAPPPPEVNIVTVGTQPVPNIIELPGRVQAYRTAEVRARVDGIVERRLFEEGSYVAAGKPLFRIDPRQLTANVNAARAQLARAQATAWLAPFPPGNVAKSRPSTVSPGAGTCDARTTKSRLAEPATRTVRLMESLDRPS